MDAVDVTGMHERKTVLMNWGIGKFIFVRLLARQRRNEVASLPGDEKFSYSSLACETLTLIIGELHAVNALYRQRTSTKTITGNR
jgi:hypothetical protein